MVFASLITNQLFAQSAKKAMRKDRFFEYRLIYNVEKNYFKDYFAHCLIERLDAETFNYEDENIRFNIVPDNLYFTMRIYNKSNQEMICRWERALFVINDISYNIIYIDDYAERHAAIFAPRYIAPQSFYDYRIKAPITFIYRRKDVKKYGPTIVRLLIPIVVNGKEIMYDFKYRVSYWDKKNDNRVKDLFQKEK